MYKYFVGCDFGTQNDYTAISLVERTVTNQLDMSENFIVEYSVRHLERMRNVEYPVIIQRIVEMFSHAELKDNGKVIVDATGVGLPLMQALGRHHLSITGVIITGGNDVTKNTSSSSLINVPKHYLVNALLLLFQSGCIKISSELELASVLQEELQTFGFRINKRSGTATYESMVTQVHDDLVISLALPVWYAGRYDNFAVPEGYRASGETQTSWDPLRYGLER